MRAVDEKFDVDAGVLVAVHCVAGVRKIEAAALNGLKTGRKDERFMAWVTEAQSAVMARGSAGWMLLEMFSAKHPSPAGARAEFSGGP
jgi:uracil DNA glycosylase